MSIQESGMGESGMQGGAPNADGSGGIGGAGGKGGKGTDGTDGIDGKDGKDGKDAALIDKTVRNPQFVALVLNIIVLLAVIFTTVTAAGTRGGTLANQRLLIANQRLISAVVIAATECKTQPMLTVEKCITQRLAAKGITLPSITK